MSSSSTGGVRWRGVGYCGLMSAVLERVRLLADWVGAGKRVTARAVLRPVDVPAVARTLGIELPEHVRSAAEVPELHVVWVAALATGAVEVHGGQASRRPVGSFHVDDRLTALAAVFGDLLQDELGTEAADVAQRMLTALHFKTPACRFDGLLLDVLYDFGAIDEHCRPTEFGRIARMQLTPFDATDAVTGACLLRITHRYVRPSRWGKVLVPATFSLNGIWRVVQVMDRREHMPYLFTVGRRQFDVTNDSLTIGRAFTKARRTITCDIGSERYEITLEQAVAETIDTPRCVASSPPGDLDEVNRDLAWIGGVSALRRSD